MKYKLQRDLLNNGFKASEKFKEANFRCLYETSWKQVCHIDNIFKCKFKLKLLNAEKSSKDH